MILKENNLSFIFLSSSDKRILIQCVEIAMIWVRSHKDYSPQMKKRLVDELRELREKVRRGR